MEKETRKLQPIKWHQGAFHKRSSICEASGQDKFHFVPSPCAFKSPSNLQCEKKRTKKEISNPPCFPSPPAKGKLGSHLQKQKALTILHSTFPCARLCWEQGRSRNSGVRPSSPWNQVWVALEFAYRSYPPLISGAKGQCLHPAWGEDDEGGVCLHSPAKTKGFGQETRMADVVAGVCCTAFPLHHLCCLPCTLLGLINIPHLLCNVFSPCKTTYLLLACKLHACQSG